MNNSRNQIWAYIIFAALILTSILYYSANEYFMYLIIYIWFGVAYGMMLQYGRFCFASASRDLFIAGVPRMAVGIIIALIFFSIVGAFLSANGLTTFHPGPIGTHEVIGGIIFGIGMVLAGGCASGSLYKIGEGNGTSILAIIGISFGQAIFVDLDGIFNKLVPQSWIDSALSKKWIPSGKITSWFDYFVAGNVFNKKMLTIAKTKFISSLFSNDVRYFVGDAFINTILPSVILLALIYYFYPRKTFIRRRRGEKGSTGIGDEIAGIWNMITSSKRTSTMGILIGITAGLHILAMRGMQLKYGVNNFGQLLSSMGYTKDVSSIGKVFDPGYWYITTQEAQFGAWILEKFGWNMRDNVFFGVMNGIPQLWRNPALWMSVGIVFGAMVMALLNNEFKFKLPKGELIVWGLGGGLLMGIGARVALGCNIGAFFIRVAGGDPGGWLFGIGMVVGAFISVRFFNWWSERKMAKEMPDFDIEF